MKSILAFIIFLGTFYTEGVAQTPCICLCCRCNDSLALRAFHKAMNGNQWEKNWNDCGLLTRHWDFSKGLDSLCGVELRNGRVYGIFLSGTTMLGDTILPDSFFNLCRLEVLRIGENKQLKSLFPEQQMRQMPLLTYLEFTNDAFYGTIQSLNYWKNLEQVFLGGNRLNGIVPRVDSLANLGHLDISNNEFDSLPPSFNKLKGNSNFLVVNNRFTFDDLLDYSSNPLFKYSPQKPIFKDINYQISTGETLDIDLSIDKGVSKNTYYWSKRSLNSRVDAPFILFDSTTVNRLVLTNMCSADIAEYKCEVKNPQLPLLTLSTYDSYYHNRHIYVNVIGDTKRDTLRPSICKGQTHIRPSGETATTEGVYIDTLRGFRNRCDSLIVTTFLKVDSLAIADAQDDEVVFPKNEMTIVLAPLTNDKFRPNPIVTIIEQTHYDSVKILSDNRFSYTRRPLLSGNIIFKYRMCDSVCNTVCDSATATLRIDDFILENNIGITPNGDGENDKLVFDLLDNDLQKYAHNKLIIFNTLGQILYQAQPYGNDWEGTYLNGTPVPVGSYLFLLELNNSERLSGSISVIR